MKKGATLVFDIGKTNKKLYVLDYQFNELHKEYIRFEETIDDDGDSIDDLNAISNWVLESADRLLSDNRFEIKKINFSTYGASMVHLNEEGKVVAPFYNYLKEFPDDLKADFFRNYGDETIFSKKTATPYMGFLNSGLQLYYLKHRKPHLFKSIAISLHFPQYLSFLFTKNHASEFTSIGCHTFLWDYEKSIYSSWLKEEGFESILPSPSNASSTRNVIVNGKNIEVGIGVHDSTSALIPYLIRRNKPFALISTGTWSICLNPFNDKPITEEESKRDCLNFLLPSGRSMKASRLFLGKEIREQAIKIGEHFDVEYHRYKEVKYDPSFVPKNRENGKLNYRFNYLDVKSHGLIPNENGTHFGLFDSFDHAYHQLIHELTDIQIQSLKLVLENQLVEEVFIDGGFANNELFVQMIANKLPDCTIKSTKYALGSSLGAAILVNQNCFDTKVFTRNYQAEVYKPLRKENSLTL